MLSKKVINIPVNPWVGKVYMTIYKTIVFPVMRV
jgi:hypothetical protein